MIHLGYWDEECPDQGENHDHECWFCGTTDKVEYTDYYNHATCADCLERQEIYGFYMFDKI